MDIKTISDFRAAVRNGPFAWPGGYPLYWVMADGGACAFNVAKTERRNMLWALVNDCADPSWQPVALVINYEDSKLVCDHTGERIESAYAEPGGVYSDPDTESES
jgi:hypothetical protein